MPAKREQSSLLGPDFDKYVEEHKADETTGDTQASVPGGVSGTAQLRVCKLGVFKEGKNKGKPYFMASGVVVAATTVPPGMRREDVLYLHTSIGPEPLCDTTGGGEKSRKTKSEHVGQMMNWLALLGLDRDQYNTEEEMLAGMKALEQTRPHFRFRTWVGRKQVIDKDAKSGKYFLYNCNDSGDVDKSTTVKGPYPNEQAAKTANPFAGRDPTVQHVWDKTVEFSANGDAADNAVQEGPSAENGTAPDPEFTPPADDEAAGTGDDAGSSDDLDAQAEAATNGDAEAEKSLTALAESLGVGDEAGKATSWAKAVAIIRKAQADQGNGEAAAGDEETTEGGDEEVSEEIAEEAPEPWAPKKGDKVKYRPLDPADKNKKKRLPAQDCEIVVLDKKKGLADLKSGKKLYKNVKVDVLEQA